MPNGGWIASRCAWKGPTAGFFVSVGTAKGDKAVGDIATPDAKAKVAEFQQQAGTGARDGPGLGDGAVVRAAGLATYLGNNYLQLTNLGLTGD